MDSTISLTVDGRRHELTVDTRTTVLDALRDRLGVTSAKKGCDHGQCGACTVLLRGPGEDPGAPGHGRRVLSCLSLAVAHDGAEVTTADGLGPASGDELHPLAAAFVEYDAYQCGYCTPGQICSAVGMLDEAAAGHPSAVTADLAGDGPAALDRTEIAERLSGNLCRCAAYRGIVDAVDSVAHGAVQGR
ncbi:2Fe-2S iron-sulfur cluster-binding protein [Pseudonocardia spirodelae]|uniref:2Fe-2S iron-sulfur cluster-binding protein n=1 Tax=Pseudonocardia spirodelae TaxID=3133431 RepID=A0ABU8T2G3_9PSEU